MIDKYFNVMKELLEKVKSLPSFKRIPGDYWILGVRNSADTFNKYDDKFYLMKGESKLLETTGTTNPGSQGLFTYDTYNKEGVAVVKSNEWYYDLWKPGLHRGKMKALRQFSPVKFYRDGNKNQRSEEIGKVREDIIGINFHAASYRTDDYVASDINGWSLGCQVCNNMKDYYKIISSIGIQNTVTYCLIEI